MQLDVVEERQRDRVDARLLAQSDHRLALPFHDQGARALGGCAGSSCRRSDGGSSACVCLEAAAAADAAARATRRHSRPVRLVQVATLTGHTYRVLYLAMSPDGQTIVTGAGDETLRFWNVFPGPGAAAAVLRCAALRLA